MAVMVYIDGKNFNNNNSGRFVLPHPSINIYHHSHFLVAPFDFTAFFTLAILNRATPFL